MSCERCLVSGRVQGVFFRASTQTRALDLGVTGYARNLPDGRVEVLICGDEHKTRELKDWLWEGPTHAHVDNVECESISDQSLVSFTIS